MRKTTVAFLVVALAAFFAGGAVSSAHGGCEDTHDHSAAGSCKDDSSNWHINCGSEGDIASGPATLYANQTEHGGEIEACNDQGVGNTHGRLVVAVVANPDDPMNSGARASLDSDSHQPFPAGYINVQVSPTSPGVWCSEDSGTGSEGDGYGRSWGNPGRDGGLGEENEGDDLPGPAECIPDPPQVP